MSAYFQLQCFAQIDRTVVDRAAHAHAQARVVQPDYYFKIPDPSEERRLQHILNNENSP